VERTVAAAPIAAPGHGFNSGVPGMRVDSCWACTVSASRSVNALPTSSRSRVARDRSCGPELSTRQRGHRCLNRARCTIGPRHDRALPPDPEDLRRPRLRPGNLYQMGALQGLSYSPASDIRWSCDPSVRRPEGVPAEAKAPTSLGGLGRPSSSASLDGARDA